MNPPLKTRATTPEMIAARVSAVRSFWRKTFRKASFNTFSLGVSPAHPSTIPPFTRSSVVTQGVDDRKARGSPCRIKTRENGYRDDESERDGDQWSGQE